MNRKAATYGVWVEIIIFIVLFLGVVAIMGSEMNSQYNQNYDTTLGLNLSSSLSSLQTYQTSIVNDTTGGQASATDFGIIKLTTIPSILLSITGILWSFVSGTFIYALVIKMNLGVYSTLIAGLFQTLYVIAIGFLLLKLILRVNI